MVACSRRGGFLVAARGAPQPISARPSTAGPPRIHEEGPLMRPLISAVHRRAKAGATASALTVMALLLVLLTPLAAQAAPTLPDGFNDEVAFTGLSNPVNVEFAAGKVYVAEKGGEIKVFESLTDTTPAGRHRPGLRRERPADPPDRRRDRQGDGPRQRPGPHRGLVPAVPEPVHRRPGLRP